MKNFLKKYQNNIILTIGVILVALIAFGAGRLSMNRETEPIVIRDGENVIQANAESILSDGGEDEIENSQIARSSSAYSMKDLGQYPGMFVASKSSNKYHWPWCSWAKRIKPKNQVWYKNEQEAKADKKIRCSYFEDNAPGDYKEP